MRINSTGGASQAPNENTTTQARGNDASLLISPVEKAEMELRRFFHHPDPAYPAFRALLPRLRQRKCLTAHVAPDFHAFGKLFRSFLAHVDSSLRKDFPRRSRQGSKAYQEQKEHVFRIMRIRHSPEYRGKITYRREDQEKGMKSREFGE